MAGLSRVNVPVATRASVSSVHSSSEPVHQWMRAGRGQRCDLVDEVEDALVGGRSGARLGAGLRGRWSCRWRPAWRSSGIPLAASRYGVSHGIVVGESVGPVDHVGLRRPRGPDATSVRSPYILDRSKAYGADHSAPWTAADALRARPAAPCHGLPGPAAPERFRTPRSVRLSSSSPADGPRATRGQAPVAQRIEHLTTDQKVGGSNPSGRAEVFPGQHRFSRLIVVRGRRPSH